jgi:sugar transferase (PEP-CTERM/EpsH1 system associated)
MQRLLFLSHRIPYPPDKGEKIRAWHILKYLAARHEVHLGCLVDDPEDWAHLPVLRRCCADVACFAIRPWKARVRATLSLRPGRSLSEGYFHHAGLARWVAGTLRAAAIDRAFVFCSAMAPYLMHAAAPPHLLDMVDVDSDKFAAYGDRAAWPMRAIWHREARTLRALERRAAAAFDRTLLVSTSERQRFLSLAPEAADRTAVLENGVDLERFAPGGHYPRPFAERGPHIVFTGRMDYWPNADAVGWFANEVLPLLQARRPGTMFHIVGAAPSAAVRMLATRPGIAISGRVADTRPYLAHADLVVAPLRIARGVQTKVLEAMAMGRPVLATSAAAEGIHARPSVDLLVADAPEVMAAAAARVLDGGCPELGARARRAMEQRHDWRMTLAALDALWPCPPTEPSPASASVPRALLPESIAHDS